MPRKRKASSPISTNRNHKSRRANWRESHIISSSEEEEQVEREQEEQEEDEPNEIGDEEFDVKCILDEDDTRFLIDWEGPWSPTWEPKEYVNDVALQVWEEKKRNRSARKRKLVVDEDSSQSQSLSFNSTNQDPVHSQVQQPLRRQTEEQRRPSVRSPSPLFVSSESAHENRRPEETNTTPREIQNSTGASTKSLGFDASIGADSSPIPETFSSRAAPIFEYIPASPVPTEYRLPGESGNSAPAARQSSDGFGDPLVSALASTSSFSSKHSQLDGQAARTEERIDEIAETPPVYINGIGSKTLRTDPVAREGASQAASRSVEPNSYSSGKPSQIHRPDRVFDSASAGFSSPCVRSSISNPYRNKPTRESTPSDTSQRIDNYSSNIPHSQSVHLGHYRPPNISSRTMDEKGQEKGAPPLASMMEKYSHIEGSTPREKMKNAYAQLRAKQFNPKPSSQAPSVSVTPSSAGDIEHSAPVSLPDSAPPLSLRTDKRPASQPSHPSQPQPQPQPLPLPANAKSLEPPTQMENSEFPAVQTIRPSALSVSHVEEPSPGSVQLGPSEFAIPLPMDSRLKDVYNHVLEEEARDIQEFLNSFSPQSEISESERDRLVTKIGAIVERLNNITTHPDLDFVGHIKGLESDLEKEASWAEYSSAKFLFLGYIVEIASKSDIHLVIMVQAGKGAQVLERYLIGKGLVYTRPREEMGGGTNIEVSMTKGSLSFGIQTTTENTRVLETYKRPLAVIAFDSTFNAKIPSVEHIRTTYARNGNLLPVIRLLVSNSSEHVGRCFIDFPETQRLQQVIRHTVRLRDVVGDLQDDALGVHENAEEVMSWILADNLEASWPLPAIEPLHIAETDNTEPELGQQTTSGDLNSQHSSAAASSVQKRVSDMEGDTQPSLKRQRVVPSQDPSLLAGLSTNNSQTLNSNLQALETNLVQMKVAYAVELKKLQKSLADSQRRLQEKEMTLGFLQHRYESQTREFHKIRQERDRLIESNHTSEQRIGKQKEEIVKLRDERYQLKHELQTARDSLKTGGGSLAELEGAREEARALSTENASLRRKAEYEKNQCEYTREQYQNASTMAAQSGNEILQLRQENETLRRKVAGEASRLKEINVTNDETRHLSRIAELEDLLSSRETILNRKETELREIRKNRPSTRSTSIQPRSPKLAANSRPSSPGIVNRGSHLRHSSESGSNNNNGSS